jgi:hypothetical protein
MKPFEIKDSGERQKFETGAHRDTDTGKLRFDLVPASALIRLVRRFSKDAPVPMITSIEPDLTQPNERGSDLIHEYFTARVEAHLYKGELKYGRDNWTKGINLARTFGSCCRHLFLWAWGDTAEDHLAAVAVNAMFLMCTEREIAEGRLPENLGDMGWLKNRRK